MSSSNVMWVEKYRPQKISELVNQKETIGSISSMLKNQSELPHLLFSGSAGVGKLLLHFVYQGKSWVNIGRTILWSLMHLMSGE